MPEAFEIEGGVLRKYRGGEAHVVIPDGVTRIGEEAFRCCEALASVSIPKGVTEIGESDSVGALACSPLPSPIA